MGSKIRALKDNFWSRKRIESGLKIKDVADAIGFSTGIVGMYFTGQRIPAMATIEKLCDLFDVDILIGTHEFIEANRAWDAEFGVKSRLHVDAPVLDDDSEAVPEKSEIVSESVLRALYGELSYDDFEAILEGNMSVTEVLKSAYKKVDFDTYMKLVKITKEGQ